MRSSRIPSLLVSLALAAGLTIAQADVARSPSVRIGNLFYNLPSGIAFVQSDAAAFIVNVNGGTFIPGTAAPDDSIHQIGFNNSTLQFAWGRIGDTVVARLTSGSALQVDLQLISQTWPGFSTTYTPVAGGIDATASMAGGGTASWKLRVSTTPVSSSASKLTVAVSPSQPVYFVAGFGTLPDFAGIDAALQSATDAYTARRPRAQGDWGDFVGAMADNLNNTKLYGSDNKMVAHTVTRAWVVAGEPNSSPYFCWDSFFNGLVSCLDDPATARDTIRAVLSGIQPNGFVPNFSHWNSGRGYVSANRSQPPVGAMCVWKMQQFQPSLDFLREVYPKLARWHSWWMTARDGNHDGLLEWGGDIPLYECGWDDTPHFDGYKLTNGTMNVNAIDLNSLYTADAQYLARIADALGLTSDAAAYRAESDTMIQRINTTLWNDSLKMYCSRFWNGTTQGAFLTRITPMNFYPLIAGVPDATRAQSVLAALTNTQKFWGTWVLPTVPYDDAYYPQQAYWRGKVWPPVNYLVFQGLKRYGTAAQIEEFARKSVSIFMTNWQANKVCGENYLSTTGVQEAARSDAHYTWGSLLCMIGLEYFLGASDADTLQPQHSSSAILGVNNIPWGGVPQTVAQTTIAQDLFNGAGYAATANLVGLAGGVGWSGAWTGSSSGGMIQDPGLAVAGIAQGAHRVALTGGTADNTFFRQLAATQGTDNTTVWLSFLVKKDSGQRYFGLSLFQDATERLFIGTPNSSNFFRFGPSTMTSCNGLDTNLLVARIDFRPGNDTAYLFANPPTDTEPDVSSAIATIQGNFAFNRIRLAAGGGTGATSGSVNQTMLGTQYTDVVLPSNAGNPDQSVVSWEKVNNALSITTPSGVLKLLPYADGTLQVQYGTQTAVQGAKSFVVARQPATVDWTLSVTASTLQMVCPSFTASVDRATGRISLMDSTGKLLIQEPATGSRTLPTSSATTVKNLFRLTSTEALYGLGEFRDNALNLRGRTRELKQFNTQASVPVILSTNGWGLFWDNPSRTVFSESGNTLSLTSDVGGLISYYLFTGSRLDDLVARYRELTGAAPMPPKWALGYHQSRNRYSSQTQLLSVAAQMRSEGIPMDSIFLDYFYWTSIGTHTFNSSFPNPAQMVQQLHAQGTKLVITVWPALAAGTSNYTALNNIGGLLTGVTEQGGTIYDPFNPNAVALYWQQIASSLVPVGIDGWFLDGPEPEDLTDFVNATTYAGPGKAVQNLYSFMHSANFAAGLRSAQPNQRAYIITRCAWAAQQRNGTVVWSGDIATTFAELKTQIAAGLNFVASGIPYWTTDIGGYSGGDPADPAYEELYTRWWEYGTFCPIFRSHGSRAGNNSNELWSYGPAVQATCTTFDTLRYRLLPYIYTLSGRVTQDGYTPMRLLAFDFPSDPAVLDIRDQFLYGPSLLVNPVITAGATSRSVYLPAGTDWIDFWTGDAMHGGQQITAAAPLTRIPLYVRAGTILPLGPAMQYSSEKPQDPIELRIYRGANGSFTLYEDDGATYGYEQGQFSKIPITWNDSLQSLTIGARQGTYPGLIGARTFHIVWVDSGHGVGVNEDVTDQTVNYTGARLTVSPPFSTWIKRFFPGVTDPAIIGPKADPDTDSTMNLTEFAIGSTPSAADGLGTLPVQNWTTVDSQTYLSLDVRRPLGRTGISYQARVSGDLQNWSDAVEQGSPTPDGTDFEIIHFRDIVPATQAAKRYIRLEILSN